MPDPLAPVAGLSDLRAAAARPLNPLHAELSPLSRAPAPSGEAARARAEATAVAFEAAMLTSFVEPMLPGADSAVWGGTGANAWRGLFAQEIAAEIARAGGIGLADTVRPVLLQSASASPAPATQD